MLINGSMILFSIWCLFGLIGAGFVIAEDIYENRKAKYNWPIGFKILIIFFTAIDDKCYKYGWRILDLNKYN